MEEKERVNLANGQSISAETILKLDDSFNIAMLLGKTILATAYQLSPSDDILPAVEDSAHVAGDVALENGNLVFPSDEYETKIENQMRQLKALFKPEMQALLRPSALFDMLLFGASLFGIDSDSLETDYEKSNANKIKAAVAWMIAKRVFSIRHPDETIKVVNLTEPVIRESSRLSFSPFDDADRIFVSEICNSVSFSDGSSSFQSEFTKVLSQLSSSGKIMLPSSKAFRMQREIAASGVERQLSVGRGAIINASITGKDGKPLGLSLFEMQIEATIGQLFQENGFKTLYVSPAQIYRKYADLPADATVSPAEIKDTIEAMDKLIITPATLDFTEQIEKHTRMKRRDGFDYDNPKRRGTLITGVHDMNPIRTHNGFMIEDSFTIHEMPMFYAYSYAIGQIYTVPANYLTGGPEADPTSKKIKARHQDAQPRRISKDDIALRRYLLEYIEYQKGEWEKRDKNLRRKNKPVPPFFEFDLPFESIANVIFKGNDAAQKRAEAAQKRTETNTGKKSQSSAKAGATEKQLRSLREQTYDFMMLQVKLGNIKQCNYYKSGRSLRGVKIRF